jgi:hypothetical protein
VKHRQLLLDVYGTLYWSRELVRPLRGDQAAQILVDIDTLLGEIEVLVGAAAAARAMKQRR